MSHTHLTSSHALFFYIYLYLRLCFLTRTATVTIGPSNFLFRCSFIVYASSVTRTVTKMPASLTTFADENIVNSAIDMKHYLRARIRLFFSAQTPRKLTYT